MTREIILDTETTGLHPSSGHRIIEIGAIEMIDKIVTGEEFHVYINPERDVPEEAYRIHGLSTEFLKDKPLFNEIADDFLSFIEGGVLVIHNAQFDIRFLNHELSLLNKMPLEFDKAIDTLLLARRAFPGTRVNLDALCKKFKIDNTMREHHGALLDSHLLSQVYVELTGGRQASFSLKASKSSDESLENKFIKAVGNNVVIQASEEEKERHKKFMETIS